MLRRLLNQIEEYLVGIALFGMSLFVFAQVLSRHLIHRSFSFTEEIVRYLLIWATFLGAAAATRQRAHLGITYISRKWGERTAFFTRLLGSIATALLFLVVFLSSLYVLRLQIDTGQRTPGLAWPIAWATLSVTVGSALIVARAIQAFIHDVRKR